MGPGAGAVLVASAQGRRDGGGMLPVRRYRRGILARKGVAFATPESFDASVMADGGCIRPDGGAGPQSHSADGTRKVIG